MKNLSSKTGPYSWTFPRLKEDPYSKNAYLEVGERREPKMISSLLAFGSALIIPSLLSGRYFLDQVNRQVTVKARLLLQIRQQTNRFQAT